MFSGKDNRHRYVLLAVGLVLLAFGVMIFIVPPSADPDPSWGFQVMHCMEKGGKFNLNSTPDPSNIKNNVNEFLAWWSPGQYLAPYFFKAAIKVNTGQGIALTVIICCFIGLAGFYALFKRLGFTRWIAAISVAFIASQFFFILPFVFYTGGEVLLFAFAGWFLYGCLGFQKVNWQLLLFLFISGLAGFICKSSVLWMFVAGVACVWINISANTKDIRIWLRNSVLLALPMMAAIAIIYVFYMSKGENPSSASGAWKVLPETFLFPMASPLLAGFSLDELFNGFIYHPDGAILSYGWTIVILIILAAASIGFMVMMLKKAPDKNYAEVLMVFYVMANVFFTYLYLKQAAISFEGRHFRIIGLLTVPGVLYLFGKTRFTRLLLAIMWVGFLCWDFKYFKAEYRANLYGPHGSSGISQQLYDKETVNELTRLDQAHHGDAIFVLNNPDISTEIVNNRITTLDVEDLSAKDLAEMKYEGKVGTIYILMPKAYVKTNVAQSIAKSFTAYHHFTFKPLGKDYYLYTATD